jgi:hypothetical protein
MVAILLTKDAPASNGNENIRKLLSNLQVSSSLCFDQFDAEEKRIRAEK